MDRLAASLRPLGARVIPFPTVRIAPVEDPALLDAALRSWRSYDWVVFTSTNGVEAVRARARDLGLRLPVGPPRIAAVGPSTKAAAAAAGLPADAMPDEYRTVEIAGVLGPVSGQRVLLPRSALATESLADRLRAGGARVDEVPAYTAIPASPDLSRVRDAEAIDLVLFTSASAVRNLVALLPPSLLDRIRRSAKAACIGPVTADVARAFGFRVGVVAREHTVSGLVRDLREAAVHG